MDILNRIIEIRKDKGLSQRDLAEKLGIATFNYGRIERGETNLTIDRLDQISKALGVHITTFFDFPDKEAIFRLFYRLACQVVGHDGKPPMYLLGIFTELFVNASQSEHIAYTWFLKFLQKDNYKILFEESLNRSFDGGRIHELEFSWAQWHNKNLFYEALEHEFFRDFVFTNRSLISVLSSRFFKYAESYFKEKRGIDLFSDDPEQQ